MINSQNIRADMLRRTFCAIDLLYPNNVQNKIISHLADILLWGEIHQHLLIPIYFNIGLFYAKH